MGRAAYLLCETVALYAICAAFLIGLLYFSGFHFTGNLMSYMVAGMLVALAPMSFTAATRGTWVSEGSVDRTAPVRPLAAFAPAAVTLLGSSELPLIGGRQSFGIAFAGGNGIDSIDVTERLSGHLSRLGIAHSHLGGIHVQDGAAQWRLDPVLGAPQLEAWVEAADPADRAAVIAAITDFLKQDCKLIVEVTR